MQEDNKNTREEIIDDPVVINTLEEAMSRFPETMGRLADEYPVDKDDAYPEEKLIHIETTTPSTVKCMCKKCQDRRNG